MVVEENATTSERPTDKRDSMGDNDPENIKVQKLKNDANLSHERLYGTIMLYFYFAQMGAESLRDDIFRIHNTFGVRIVCILSALSLLGMV